MTLNASGPISLGGATAGQSVNLEIGQAATAQVSFNTTAVRTLTATNASTALAMPTGFYGKSLGFTFNATISANTSNYNLRSAAVAAGWNQTVPLNATVTINSGVFVSSTSTSTRAFDTGATFPSGTALALINNGTILGRGGNGGNGGGVDGNGNSYPPTGGGGGGPAFIAQYAITLTNNGTIGGGGAGGGGGNGYIQPSGPQLDYGGGGGGGGRGVSSGGAGGTSLGGARNGQAGGSGTLTGAGGGGASGGSSAAAGASGGGLGNGACINGNSNITYLATGTRLGSIT